MYRPSPVTFVVVLLVAMLAMMALAVSQRALLARRGSSTAAAPVPATTTSPAPPVRPEPTAAPSPKAPRPAPGFRLLRVRSGQTVSIRARPGGTPVGRLGSTTSFGSQDVLSVAVARGPWLGVTSSSAPNGRLVWVDGRSHALASAHTRMSLTVSLSRRRLELHQGRHVLRSFEVGVGRLASATPTGRFAVTDKLSGAAFGSYYGCCILALSGHQPNTPTGWQGSDRLAIHGTDDPSSVGAAASAGCLHANGADLRVLMRRVPLGTPVFIRQ